MRPSNTGAPRRRRGDGELPIPPVLEELPLLQGIKTSNLNPSLFHRVIRRLGVVGLRSLRRRGELLRRRRDGESLVGGSVVRWHGGAVCAQASHLASRLFKNVPGIRRRALQRRRRRRANLRRRAVGAVLPIVLQAAQNRLRRAGQHLRLSHDATRGVTTRAQRNSKTETCKHGTTAEKVTHICRGTVPLALRVADDEPSPAAREAVSPFLLVVVLAPGGDRRLLLLGEKIVVQELVRKPELHAAASGRALLRHERHAALLARTDRDRPRTCE
uniref:Uncharacterized protein n=1 Tax=Zea mays TaxID=4577 RepID=B7ZZ89_MAIZE|nr:unknown [Zea mays]